MNNSLLFTRSLSLILLVTTFSCSLSTKSEVSNSEEVSAVLDSLVYDTAPRWSRSGDKILFYTYRHDPEGAELYTITPDKKRIERLTNTYHNEWWSDISADEAHIYFSSDLGKSTRFGGSEIFSMNFDGSDIKQLTKSVDTTLFTIDPNVSPDGSMIAYCYDCIGKETNSEIYLLNMSTMEVINLTNHPSNDRSPSWSPKGDKLLFSSNRSGNYELYMLDINSNQLTQITNTSYNNTQGDWSVNDQIVFISDEDGDRELVTMNLDGTNRTKITNNDFNDVLPAWSPNGETIAFSSYRRGAKDKGDIFIIHKDGTNETLLTK